MLCALHVQQNNILLVASFLPCRLLSLKRNWHQDSSSKESSFSRNRIYSLRYLTGKGITVYCPFLTNSTVNICANSLNRILPFGFAPSLFHGMTSRILQEHGNDVCNASFFFPTKYLNTPSNSVDFIPSMEEKFFVKFSFFCRLYR